MDNKFYVSYEAARLLKEKGYNEETIYYYNSAGKLYLGNGHFNYNAYAVNLSAPSKSEAIDWLESKGIVVCVYLLDLSKWGYTIINHKDKHIFGDFFEDKNRLKTEEAAIIKALELL
jgi:hypothetical protein